MQKYFLILFFSILMLPIKAAAAGFSVDVQAIEGGDRVVIDAGGSTSVKVFTLENPKRVVIDVPNAKKQEISLPEVFNSKLITNLRSGQFDAKTARIVLETKSFKGMKSEQSAGKIVVTLLGDGLVQKNNKATVTKPTEKPLIVIDPGHGGQDPGASGANGTLEKEVVLKYAKILKSELEKNGKYRAMLTRDSDYFIRLRERFAQARQAKATLFISIHADSAKDAARGLSVYTLSENASDKEAEDLAAQENKSDIIAGMDLSTHDEDVANILISLAQRETNISSAMFADSLISGMRENNVPLLENTHRYAGFAVLKAPDIPSVLVEIGFISHPEEEKKLVDEKHRKRIVKGIMDGIEYYFQNVNKLK